MDGCLIKAVKWQKAGAENVAIAVHLAVILNVDIKHIRCFDGAFSWMPVTVHNRIGTLDDYL